MYLCNIMYFCSSKHLIWSPNTVGISGARLKEGRSLKIILVKEGKDLVICPWCWENVGIIGLDLLNDYVNVIILHITFQIIWDGTQIPLRHFKEVIEEDLCMVKDWNFLLAYLKKRESAWKLKWSGMSHQKLLYICMCVYICTHTNIFMCLCVVVWVFFF